MALNDTSLSSWNLNSDFLDAFGLANGVNNGVTFNTATPMLGSASGIFSVNDDIALADDTYNAYGSGTVSGWVYPTIAQQMTIFAAASSTVAGEFFRVYLYQSGGNLYLAVQGDSVSAVRTTNTIPLNTKTMFAVRSNGSAWELFIDNNKETPVIVGGSNTGYWFSDITSGVTRYCIGVLNRSSGKIQYMNGELDAINIHSGQLTDSEITVDLWNGGAGVELEPSVGFNPAWARNSNQIIGAAQ